MAKKLPPYTGPVNGLGGAVTPSNSVMGLPHGVKPPAGFIIDDVTVATGQFAGAYAEFISGAADDIASDSLIHFHLPNC
jgi:hypothetical protein